MLACSAGQIISFQVTYFPINEMPYFLQREGKFVGITVAKWKSNYCELCSFESNICEIRNVSCCVHTWYVCRYNYAIMVC